MILLFEDVRFLLIMQKQYYLAKTREIPEMDLLISYLSLNKPGKFLFTFFAKKKKKIAATWKFSLIFGVCFFRQATKMMRQRWFMVTTEWVWNRLSKRRNLCENLVFVTVFSFHSIKGTVFVMFLGVDCSKWGSIFFSKSCI